MTIYHHHHYDQEEAKARPELLVPRAVGVPQDPQSCKPETSLSDTTIEISIGGGGLWGS